MVKENDFVAIFHSIHRVLKAEQLLKEAAADFMLIPVPRQLSSDCGLALRIDPEHRQAVLDLLAASDLKPVELYRKEGDDFHLCEGEGPVLP